jgi:pimeloyl-ACP methyl ester carboxylesterase
MAKVWKLIASLCVLAGLTSVAPAHADGPITYTLEPWDGDGVIATFTLTQLNHGGSLCPCVKIPYPATGLPRDIQKGADNIAKVSLKPGDTVLGFSLGQRVVSLYLAQHTPPPGVKFLLDGATLESNQKLVDEGTGVPWDIPAPVTMVANEYDGWSDFPDKAASPGYNLAVRNANAGKRHVHNYINAQLHHPANVVTTRGNITAILIPTQKLPLNDGLRLRGLNAEADRLDAEQRAQIDDAYSRPKPSPEQLAAATDEQVGVPPAPIYQTPEPVAVLDGG